MGVLSSSRRGRRGLATTGGGWTNKRGELMAFIGVRRGSGMNRTMQASGEEDTGWVAAARRTAAHSEKGTPGCRPEARTPSVGTVQSQLLSL